MPQLVPGPGGPEQRSAPEQQTNEEQATAWGQKETMDTGQTTPWLDDLQRHVRRGIPSTPKIGNVI